MMIPDIQEWVSRAFSGIQVVDEEVERRETHAGLGQRGDEAPQGESQKASATSPHLPDTMARPETSAWVRLDVYSPTYNAAFDSHRLVLRSTGWTCGPYKKSSELSPEQQEIPQFATFRLLLWICGFAIHCCSVSHGVLALFRDFSLYVQYCSSIETEPGATYFLSRT